jgi:hypothetical protein
MVKEKELPTIVVEKCEEEVVDKVVVEVKPE